MLDNLFAQSGRLLLINLKRDRYKILIWLLVLVGLMVGYASKISVIYASQNSVNALMETLRSPAMIAVLGVTPAHVKVTEAILFASEMLVFIGLFYGLASLLLAVNLTHGDEEQGLTELIRAKHVGRQSTLVAAFLESVVFNFLLFILVGAGLQVANMAGSQTNGNWLAAALLSGFGLLFGVVGILMAQIASETRTALTYSVSLLGLTYLVRMVIDVKNPDNNWWSPLGWLEHGSVYHENNWWPVVLLVLATAVVLFISLVASAHRDIGAGLIAGRAGKATSRFLRGPLTTLIKVDGKSFWSWLFGAFIMGLMYGSIFNSITDVLKSNQFMSKMFSDAMKSRASDALLLQFLATLAVVFVVVGSIRGVMLVNKIDSDAKSGYLEPLLARPISRLRLFSIYVGYALINGLVTFIAGVGGLYAGNLAVMSKHPLAFKYFLRLVDGYSVTIVVMIALSAVVIAFQPRLKGLPLVYAGIGFVMMYFRSIFKLKDWVIQLVPFGWMRKIPVKPVDQATFLGLLIVAVVLLLIAGIRFRQRDQIMN
ncbi:MAG: permease [Lactobacillaceae bacterium]|jgi:ABC-2 type transport system permease protein|nr:permease [Lactobacillaceae bacterium]